MSEPMVDIVLTDYIRFEWVFVMTGTQKSAYSSVNYFQI